MSIEIKGFVADGFAPVRDVFAKNFAERGEIGAGFALFQDGEKLIDIHAGHADRQKTHEWAADTLVPVFSTGKAITALVMAWLVDQGRISYETKLADIWPDFAAHGKGAVTLGHALSHQAGLSGFTDEMEAADWFDAGTIEARLAAMTPIWPLGEGSGYHPITYGFLADAAARRTDEKARSVGGILRAEIAGPRGIDVFIGTPESEHERCAEHVLPPRAPKLGEINAATEAAFLKPWSTPGRRGKAQWRAAEFPAANAHATAGGIAELMGAFANKGRVRGEALVGEAVIEEAMRPRVSGPDRVLPFDLTIGAGVMINRKGGHYGPEPETVGHYGFGGSCGFADPVRGLSGSYVMNRQMDVLIGDARAVALIEAVYGCL